MPLPGVRGPVHGGAPCEALGRRGRDEPQEQASTVPAAPPYGPRGAGEGLSEPRRDGAVLHATGAGAGRCAEDADMGQSTQSARQGECAEGEGAGGCTGGSGAGGSTEGARAGRGTRAEGAGGFAGESSVLAAGPIGASRRPINGRTSHALQRRRALQRFSHPLGDRSRCPGSRGGVSGSVSNREEERGPAASASDASVLQRCQPWFGNSARRLAESVPRSGAVFDLVHHGLADDIHGAVRFHVARLQFRIANMALGWHDGLTVDLGRKPYSSAVQLPSQR